MTAVAVPGPVEDYVRDLARELRGPARTRREMLREIRDGLDDATGALTGEGLPRREAEQLAVEEFGPVAELAPQLQRELAVHQARWTAGWSAVSLVLLWVAWDAVWVSAPHVTAPATAVGAGTGLSRLIDVFGLTTALLCLGALVVLQVAGTRMRRPELLARVIGRTTLGGVVATYATSLTLTVLAAPQVVATLGASALHWAVVTLTLAVPAVLLVSAHRCVGASDLHRNR
ncbi:hypothetical protein NUM3379_35430 [Kineococcus sp. NUM-3379]